jgi:hypothetical protein
MTARFSVKNSHIEDGLILVLKKQTPAVKVIVITVRLKFLPSFGQELQTQVSGIVSTNVIDAIQVLPSFLPSFLPPPFRPSVLHSFLPSIH